MKKLFIILAILLMAVSVWAQMPSPGSRTQNPVFTGVITLEGSVEQRVDDDTYINSMVVGTVYYVDATLGNDSNDGLTPTTAFLTLAKIITQQTANASCNTYLLKRGEEWIESFNMVEDCTYISNYGALSDPKPMIIGAESAPSTGSWTDLGSDTYSCTYTRDPGAESTTHIWYNRVTPLEEGSGAGSLTENQYFWAANVLTVKLPSGETPLTSGIVDRVEIPYRDRNLALRANNLSIKDVQLWLSDKNGAEFNPSSTDVSGIHLDGVDAYNAGTNGIAFIQDTNTTSDVLIENFIIDGFAYKQFFNACCTSMRTEATQKERERGIHGLGDAVDTNIVIRNGYITNYAVYATSGVSADSNDPQNGIQMANFNGLEIYNVEITSVDHGIVIGNGTADTEENWDIHHNYTHHTADDSFFLTQSIDADAKVHNNLFVLNSDNCVDALSTGDMGDFYNNTCHSSYNHMLEVAGGAGALLAWKNNITDVDSVMQADKSYVATVDATADITNSTFDNNVYYGNSEASPFSQNERTTTYTWTEWKALGHSPDGASVITDPALSSGNYKLAASSSAVGIGALLGSSFDNGIHSDTKLSDWQAGTVINADRDTARLGWDAGAYVFEGSRASSKPESTSYISRKKEGINIVAEHPSSSVRIYSGGSGDENLVFKVNSDGEGSVRTETVIITNAELLTLATSTGKELVPAKGADILIEFVGAVLIQHNKTAFTETTDDIVIQYTDSGVDVSQTIDATGFVDQTSDEVRIVTQLIADPAVQDYTASVGQGLSLFNAGGNWTDGTNGYMVIKISYKQIKLGL